MHACNIPHVSLSYQLLISNRQRFAPTLEALHAAGVKSGDEILESLKPSNPLDWLSLVLLLDQIPRNCYRGDSSFIVFKYFDPLARDIALAAIKLGIPDKKPVIRWQFTYRSWFSLPLMHSENASDHETATAEFQLIADDVRAVAEMTSTTAADPYKATAAKVVQKDIVAAIERAELSIGFEKRHFAIIKQFGRYPHRNEAMGRESTTEEKEYLEAGGETFGSSSS